ncbi:MAG: hypothetical protein JO001_12890 [Alphaproteobacteria bacterium]|nr:hypothetical protein [Alphaproteobacteria bacterium]
MEDADDVEKTAAEYLARLGTAAVEDLRERAEMAAADGDDFSAAAWTDIADAAKRLLDKRYSI